MVDTLVGDLLATEEKDSGFGDLMESGKDKGFGAFEDAADLVPDEIAGGPELEELFSSPDFAVEYLDDGKLDFGKKREESEELTDAELAQDFSDKTNDPVRMYLREMGTVPLLTREGEIELARRIERGQKGVRKSLSRSPVVALTFQ